MGTDQRRQCLRLVTCRVTWTEGSLRCRLLSQLQVLDFCSPWSSALCQSIASGLDPSITSTANEPGNPEYCLHRISGAVVSDVYSGFPHPELTLLVIMRPTFTG